MSEPVRLAGHGHRPDGAVVTWTVADGHRGRRWREVVTHGQTVVHSLLLETDPHRRFSHLELSVPDTLLTLHPETDGTLHGNRVSADGSNVTHIRGQAFGVGAFIVVAASPVSWAAVAWALQGVVEQPGFLEVPLVVVDGQGQVGPTTMDTILRFDTERWGVEVAAAEPRVPRWVGEGVHVAPTGIPVLRTGTSSALDA